MSGTLTALGTAALGLGLCVLVAGVGQGAHTAAVASGAADLAALAGADALRGIDPTGTDACTVAEAHALRSARDLSRCILFLFVLVVVVPVSIIFAPRLALSF